MARFPTLLAAILLPVLAGAPDASAQTAGTATGSIDGTVTDTTNALLPGVTIVASGDGLMRQVSVTSGPDGTDPLTGLPPGTYALEFSLHGLRSQKLEGIAVALDRTTTADITLDLIAFEQSVDVKGEVRIVDRHATTLATGFTARELAHLPGSRTPDAILWATPSVSFDRIDVGGSTPTGPFSAYGMGGTVPTIEGITVHGREPVRLRPRLWRVRRSVGLARAWYGPEWPIPGVHLQVLTKSGGNAYHGTVVAAYEHRNWQSHNIDGSQIALGAAGSQGVPPREANRLRHYHDVNADAGGFIKRYDPRRDTSVRHQSRFARHGEYSFQPSRLRAPSSARPPRAPSGSPTGRKLSSMASSG